jgi:preprotein translocase subunit SecD
VLWLATILALPSGCQSPQSKHKKVYSTLRVHLEAGLETPDRNQQIQVSRANPVSVNVQKSPILTEASVKEAKVIEVVGGFALLVRFDTQGGWLLEQYSSANLGKHFAIFSQFPIPSNPKMTEGRWLAAPRISKRLSDGVLVFTPDVTREEADQIALGLNNLAKK